MERKIVNSLRNIGGSKGVSARDGYLFQNRVWRGQSSTLQTEFCASGQLRDVWSEPWMEINAREVRTLYSWLSFLPSRCRTGRGRLGWRAVKIVSIEHAIQYEDLKRTFSSGKTSSPTLAHHSWVTSRILSNAGGAKKTKSA